METLPVPAALLCILVAAWLGRRYGKRLYARGFTLTGHIRLRECPLIPVAILAFIGVYAGLDFIVSKPQITWNVPTPVMYYLIPSLWAAKVLLVTFVCSAVATVPLLQKTRTRHAMLLIATTIVVTVEVLARVTHQPHLPELKVRERDGVILQSSAVTCAAAAGANAARALGVELTEAEVAKAMGTTWAGTAPSQVIYGMRRLGFEARKVNIRTRDIREVSPPAILLVEFGTEADGHAVALMGFDGDAAIIFNPNSGRQVHTPESLKQIWDGRAIEIRLAH